MTVALFPLFADLRGRPVLVVGGGGVARRKVAALLDAGATVTVGAPTLEPSLAGWAQAGRIAHRPGRFDPAWLDGVWLGIAATDDAATNAAVAAAGQARRVWVNVVDDAALSSFQVPARVERGPLQVAISSGGAAPMLARHLREQFERQLDESLGALATLLGRHRARIRARLPDLHRRRRFFDRVLSGPVPTLLRRGAGAEAERALLDALRGPEHAIGAPPTDAAPADTPSPATAPAHDGRVALVGAGPGDPGLLTLRALRLLNEADVILHDRLVSAQVLALARRDAECIAVGKALGGDHHATQQAIHRLLVEHARAGRRVVRLKGGDPFVFGRGGEELEALHAAGIAFEVVPGITAALACGAYAGIPLTHREHAQSVRLVTAHGQDGDPALDWAALAGERQTLAFYMGVGGVQRVRDALLAHGRAATTPVALVENGTRPEQRVVTGTLAQLPELVRTHAVQAPALLIVGEVAALATRLHWFGAAPLAGVGGSGRSDAGGDGAVEALRRVDAGGIAPQPLAAAA